MLSTWMAIAGGGALGAMMRHGANETALHVLGPGYPYGTLAVNVLGSFIMGVLISLFAHVWQPPPELKAFLVTGMLGAFTTFSTFSLQFVLLWERGLPFQAVSYVLISVTFAIAALMLGMALIRWIF